MNTFYNTCIWAGGIGTAILAIILWFSTSWWVFAIACVCIVLMEFGCFAWKEKEFMKREDDREIIRGLVKKAYGPRQTRNN